MFSSLMKNNMADMNRGPLGLYLHFPFCVRKCRYCDFLSFPSDEAGREAYLQRLKKEIIVRGEKYQDYSIETLFIGGGTPSLMTGQQLTELLDTVRTAFHVSPSGEWTMECNPGTTDAETLKIYRAAGINRLSFGLQSMNDEELKYLGRIHTAKQFLDNYQAARKAGVENINIDLMSAIPDQTYEGWIHNLRTVAGLDPEHISAYSLIIEEGTPFASRTLNLPDEDAEYNMYEATAQILREYGFEQYEISNYAKKGRECRHNVGYWIRQDYLGFGLGASSLYGKERFANTQDMKKYLENSRTPEKIREKEPPLTREDEMAEFMFLGLRMTRGISKAEFERQFGSEIDAIYGDVLRKYKSMGLLLEEKGRIFLSREGIHVSNSVMADFLP